MIVASADLVTDEAKDVVALPKAIGSDLRVIRRAASRMQRVLTDIRLSRQHLQSGDLPLSFSSMELASILRDVRNRVRAVHQGKIVLLQASNVPKRALLDGLRTTQVCVVVC